MERGFDPRPALIVRCKCAANVQQAVEFARSHEPKPAIRADDHSLSRKAVSDGGLTIDVSLMKRIRVDTSVYHMLLRAAGGGYRIFGLTSK